MRKTRRGTWLRAIGSFATAILSILAIRWAFFEPYVIPSGSMLPTLLIRDYILVNKFSYGVRLPFTSRYLVRFSTPERGNVVVFRSVEDDGIFLIKRVIGLPGEEVALNKNGDVLINGKPLANRKVSGEEASEALKLWPAPAREDALQKSDVSFETAGDGEHLVFHDRDANFSEEGPFKVPEGHILVLGDNREHSADSRVWGTLDIDRVLGRAKWIWLSCEENLAQTGQLCDPQSVRWSRVFKRIL